MKFDPIDVEDAKRTVYAHLAPTPQFAWPLLRRRLGRTVWVKHENHTIAGALPVALPMATARSRSQFDPGKTMTAARIRRRPRRARPAVRS